ncbi:Outer membrane lipoprotein LolB [Mariprofundus ferrinatatus]|uniref:Outer-membrane lipoprotein LolB n=1 Tax=Mariprofundus ferrinatatus TaxID=1921087 RepID=A0A2K8L6A5_9PROT|nr:lipoprotein insertase outer membrane protein LolB [Mariprofundus ferrinatatus]ATX81371.1 Outer membrane lipoprotein LolB [Mariprofundus ferrinatatus]
MKRIPAPPLVALLLMIGMALTAGCAKQPPQQSTTIGPYSNFSGRLIVMEPTRRWQVVIQWRAERADRGDVRLTHAATGTVVEFRWAGRQMQVRDSNDHFWRAISADQLGSHGIVMPPQQLALILLGKMPSHFTEAKPDLWESRNSGHAIRLQWYAESKKLVMTDIKQGRQATLIITP